jgi:hypothetical protein
MREYRRVWQARAKQSGQLRACYERYYQTEKSHATLRRYRQSETARATKRRYVQTEEGRKIMRASRRRYQQSEKYRASRRRYEQSEKWRVLRAQWRHSEAGRAVIRARLARRRARKRGASILELVNRRMIFDLDAGLCHLCDLPVDPQAFHIDHLIPIAVEPIEAAFNCAVTHPACNVWKSDSFDEVVLLPSARARWQARRPEHLAELDAHVARIVAARGDEEAAA